VNPNPVIVMTPLRTGDADVGMMDEIVAGAVAVV
jgi:hypothetical protein